MPNATLDGSCSAPNLPIHTSMHLITNHTLLFPAIEAIFRAR